MISFERTRQQTLPHSAVKIIGVGGAGANMLDRVALDGMEGAELLAANTDVRVLSSSVAPEKIQMGRNLTKGLGAGGDPELGRQAASEAELEIRDALRERRIVFICVGLGGGTSSGAAPLVARAAREAGAFTVVFATTPFDFEGARRRQQAETALEELSVIANALITFDNTRMGELVLAKQGVHEAFAAADRMISESIRAVTRIVMRPGLVNIGLDDLMAALDTPKSRCLFGSGLAKGENRAQQALKNALVSPLLDRGSLLHEAETVLVHICGGEDMTLYELELLMRGLSRHVPESAQILFGMAVDPTMEETMSVTVVSSLPEEALLARRSSADAEVPPLDDEPESPGAGGQPAASETEAEESKAEENHDQPKPADEAGEAGTRAEGEPPGSHGEAEDRPDEQTAGDAAEPDDAEPGNEEPSTTLTEVEEAAEPVQSAGKFPDKFPAPDLPENEESSGQAAPGAEAGDGAVRELQEGEPEQPVNLPPVRRRSGKRTPGKPRLRARRTPGTGLDDVFETGESIDDGVEQENPPEKLPPLPASEAPAAPEAGADEPPEATASDAPPENEGEESGMVSYETVEPSENAPELTPESLEEIKAAARARRPQGELELDGGPKGKFEGEEPNLLGGEDLDIPPFLRKKK